MNGALEPGSINAAIDGALRSVGTADPAPGLEGRILMRLAAARVKAEASPARFSLFAGLRQRRLPLQALGVLTSCLLAVVIVAGSVSHSRHLRPGQIVAPPSLVLPGHGIGAASAIHPAAPSSAPLPAGQGARGRSVRRSGRARIAPHAPKAPGVAVPAPGSGDSQN
jgi:hypothetical protein